MTKNHNSVDPMENKLYVTVVPDNWVSRVVYLTFIGVLQKMSLLNYVCKCQVNLSRSSCICEK